MAFAEKKFRGLLPANQAKKIADLLASSARESDPDTSARHLAEARRLIGFIKQNEIETGQGANTARGSDAYFNDERVTVHSASPPGDVYAAYLYWRRAAGLGPEAEVLRCFEGAARSDQNREERIADCTDGPKAKLNDSTDIEPQSSATDYAVWLHDIRSGYNTGAVIRTAECLGFRRVYLSGFTPGPEQRSVQSAAMGCEAWIECLRHEPQTATAPEPKIERPPDYPTLIALESPNVELPAKARCKQAIPYTDYNWPASALFVVGNEELGVPAAILADADAIVTIPMYGRKASLNLASSFAIVAARAREIDGRNES